MTDCLITVRSITPGQRGEQALRRAGISCSLQRTPRAMEQLGCGYSLRLHRKDVLSAVQLLREQQIPFRKVYFQHDSGTLEELEL